MAILVKETGLDEILKPAAQAGWNRLSNVLSQRDKQRQSEKYSTVLGGVIDKAQEEGIDYTSPEGMATLTKNALLMGVPSDVVSEGFKGLKSGERKRSSTELYQYKVNSKAVAEYGHSSNVAKDLLSESQNVFDAITSGKLPGPSPLGKAAVWAKGLFGFGPKEIQTLITMQKKTIADLKGLGGRVTNAQLKLLQESTWDPNKSEEQNLEAYRIWQKTLHEIASKSDAIDRILSENPDAIYSPNFENLISEFTEEPSKGEMAVEDFPPPSADLDGYVLRDQNSGEVVAICDGKSWLSPEEYKK